MKYACIELAFWVKKKFYKNDWKTTQEIFVNDFDVYMERALENASLNDDHVEDDGMRWLWNK